jgi:hypothetical protein
MASYKPYVMRVCRVNDGAACCKYLCESVSDKKISFECNKIVHHEGFSDPEAQGDNCRGATDLNRVQLADILVYVVDEKLEKNSQQKT